MKRALILTAAVLALPSCLLGPDFTPPGKDGGSGWKGARSNTGARLPDKWWRLFNDGDLDRLVDRALASNNDLAAARARVNTARALVGADRARLFPTLGLNGSAGIARASEDGVSSNLPPGVSVDLESQRYRGSFDLAYDADLWGRNKRQLESATAEAAASEAIYDSQRLGVATEVARQYFLLRGLDEQKSVVQRTIKSRQSTLELQQSKADAGLIDGLSTSQAKTELELAKTDLAAIDRQRGAAENAIAVLCGIRPSDLRLPHGGVSNGIPPIRPGLPAEVLNRRPDVRAAEQLLRAANAGIGVAEAAFYPNFTLIGSAGLDSMDASQFLNWQNRVLSLGASVAAPVFDGGGNRARFDAAVSRRDEALANYRTALLVALREVEDALVDLRGLSQARSSLEQALNSSRDTQRISRERYDKGISSYLEVVEADRTVLRVELLLAQIDAQQRITLAALAKALGGGWGGK